MGWAYLAERDTASPSSFPAWELGPEAHSGGGVCSSCTHPRKFLPVYRSGSPGFLSTAHKTGLSGTSKKPRVDSGNLDKEGSEREEKRRGEMGAGREVKGRGRVKGRRIEKRTR